MGKITLILGGVRSGKSTYAENMASELGADDVLYLATSEAKDDEMRARVEAHRASRPASWRTLEAPLNLAEHLAGITDPPRVILVDCLTLLVTNVLMHFSDPGADAFADPSSDPFDPAVKERMLEEVDALIHYAQSHPSDIIIVSNEVGMGIVPAYELGRAYRDLLGWANQHAARRADHVTLLVAGIPMTVK